jgi:hypothetical protein
MLTGVNDLRTPIGQTEEFYEALKVRKVPTQMVRFVDEWTARARSRRTSSARSCICVTGSGSTRGGAETIHMRHVGFSVTHRT